jgi:DNA (cytosine-5)-methyltransferase 1
MKKEFRFIDLFAGIGGMRIAFDKAGGRCVFSSENNKFSQQTYEANFGEVPSGDITKIDAKDIPNHDILVGGFPCQPFSIAGVSSKKALGREHGFDARTKKTKKDPMGQAQGTLFFDIVRIIKEKKPKAFLLENVKNLKGHDKGKTFQVIMDNLEFLGYDVKYRIVDASSVVPQHRERIFIVGFKKPMDFEFPKMIDKRPTLADILEKNVDEKYTLKDGTWNAVQRHKEKHSKKGNGFGYNLVTDTSEIAKTLSARYYKDGAEILIAQKGKNPRRLTPRECARLMGFPKSFKIEVSDNQAYRQFGNAVVVPVVKEIAKAIVKTMQQNKTRKTIVDYA